MAGFYHSVYGRLPGFLKRRINPLDWEIELFVRQASQDQGRVAVDAGAGEARFAAFFGEWLYVAVDSAVGDAQWDYSRIHLRADLAAIPLASECADVAINTQVLEHVPDPKSVLKEIGRILKPGGKLYLTAPQGWHEHQQPHDYFRFTRWALEGMFESAGFSAWSIEPMGGYFRYLGHRLSYIPKVLFQPRRGFWRVVLFPVELAALAAFCFVGPLACFYLDRFDRQKEFTLCYRCLAVK